MNYEESLMVKAAWYYFFENMTQQTIADLMGISRMRVIKLLDRARQCGIIQFRLRSDGIGRMELERALIDRYHLKDVFVIPSAPETAELNESIANAAAMYIADRLQGNACINMGYGDTPGRVLNHLAMMAETPVTCVSLTGGVSYYLPNTRSNVFNAKLYLMPAPLLASSKEMADAIRQESSIAEITRMIGLSQLTVVGIGSTHPSATVLRSGILSQNDMLYLTMNGAVGDVLSHFIDRDGRLVETHLEERLISTPLKTLRELRNVIGVAAGPHKVEAIRAVLRGGYLDVLITDEQTASHLISEGPPSASL